MSTDKQSLWYPLRLLSLYRLLVAIALLASAPTAITLDVLGKQNPNLYISAAISYVVIALFWVITCRKFQQAFFIQLYFQFVTDLTLVTLTMHASGGVQSGLGILLVVSIAGSCMLVRGITPYFLASLATFTVLGDALYMDLFAKQNAYSLAATMGAAFFGVAFLTGLLSKRLEESEAIASQRTIALANLEHLNEKIIEQFQNGIVVIDKHHRILLINQKASDLINNDSNNTLLHHLSEELNNHYEQWRTSPDLHSPSISQPGSAYDLQAHFMELDTGNGETLITLTDISDLSKKLQDQKLASLGRLTASIAHEIRNPLSAINHAAQLLNESDNISDADQRLTDIIGQQSKRLNGMVENIMQLSRKHKATPETIPLDSWLGSFRIEFCSETGLAGKHFFLNIQTSALTTQFDASQLHQILWNLCSNSMKYGRNEQGECRIHIDCQQDSQGFCYLDIYDEGSGIPPEIADHIFEPFYTTHSASSGLGLYISHELCSFNHARLNYIYNKDQQGRFRLELS